MIAWIKQAVNLIVTLLKLHNKIQYKTALNTEKPSATLDQ